MTKLLRFAVIAIFLSVALNGWGQTTIASDGFENSLTLFTSTTGFGTYLSGNSSASNDKPSSSPFAAVGTYAYAVSNPTTAETLVSSAINTTGYTGISLSLRVGAFSYGVTNNGLDIGDLITIYVSPNNGTTYYQLNQVTGYSNAYWAYSATGVSTFAYTASNQTGNVSSPAAGGSRTADGYSTMTITSLPAVAQLKVKITILNNSVNELWTIDDFKVTGTPSATNYYWNGSATTALNGTWDNATNNWTEPTATATANAAWPSAAGTYNANFNSAASASSVTVPGTISTMPANINIGTSNYTFVTTGSTAGVLSAPINLNSYTLNVAPIANAGLSLSNVISGTGALTQSGAGVTTLGTSNTYSGATTINSGYIATSGEGSFGTNPGSFTAAQITLNGGGIQAGGNMSFNSNRGLTLGASGGTFNTNGNTITVTNVVTGPGALTQAGTGTLVMTATASNNPHTYTGATNINGGTLQLSTYNNVLPQATAVVIASGATFDLNGKSQVIGSLSGVGATTATVSMGAGALTVGNSSSTTYDGIISGTSASSLTKQGAGTLTLSGANTYSGITTINAGVLSIGSIAAGGSSSPIGNSTNAAANLVLGGGTLQYTGASGSTDRSFTLTAATSSSIDVSNALSISGASANTTGALTKVGAGALTLTGANLHTGATAVNAGSLFVNNASGNGLVSGSAVSVGASGTLGGTGKAAGTLSLTGTVSPGASASPMIGNFTTGAQTWNSNANYKFDISNVAGTAGTNWDLLTSTGAIDVSAGGYTIDLTGNPTGFSNTGTYNWAFATGSSITGYSVSNFTVHTTNFTPTFTGTFTVTQGTNSLVLSYTPAASSPPVINSILTAAATYGTAFTYSITGTNTPSSYAATGLPAGLTINTTTGVISGTLTVTGGFNVSITATNAAGTSSPATLVITVAQKALTIASAAATNKVYDGTTAAVITGTLTGIYNSDAVTYSGTGNFASPNVGTGVAVTSTCTLSGAAAGNYTLTQPTGLTANIAAKALTITGVTANNKVYTRTNTATLSGTAALSGVLAADAGNVSLGGSPTTTFASYNVANGIAVTVTGYSISGTASGNYTLTQPSGLSANITPLALTINSPAASNKVYTATTAATITGTLSGIISPDAVSLTGTGTFASAAVGNGIAVTSTSTLGGSNAANYTLTQPTGLTANITPVTLTITGLTANNKVYTGTTAATLTGTASLSGVLGADAGNVTLGGTYTATFATANVGTGISVTVTGYTISGTASGNYTLTQPTGLTAKITAVALTVTGLTANNKVYTRTNTATLSGTATLNGVLPADAGNVTLGGTPAATFASLNVGNNIAVTVTGYTLTGTAAGNYTVTQPTGLTANITAVALTVTGAVANNKAYDGTTAATISGTLTGIISPDAVTLNGTGTFASSAVGNNIAVTSTSTLSGTNAGNYTLTQPTGLTANITNGIPAVLTPGNLVLDMVGDGSNSLSSSATYISLVQTSLGGSVVSTTAVPTSTVSTNYGMVASGSATADGEIALSADGGKVIFNGYNATIGTSSVSGNANGYVVGYADGSVLNSATQFTTSSVFSPDNFRSACSDGTNVWASGQDGMAYIAAGTDVAGNTLYAHNVRWSNIFSYMNSDGSITKQLYANSDATTPGVGVYSVGSGTPSSTTQTLTSIVGSADLASPYGYIFFDADPTVAGLDLLYVIGDGTDGVNKYSKTGTTWTWRGKLTGSGRGLTGYLKSNGNAVLFFTDGDLGVVGTKLYTFTDAAARTSNITSNGSAFTSVASLLYTAATDYGLKGISFTPTDIATQPTSQSVCANTSVTFTVAMETGLGAVYNYQWFEYAGSTWAATTDATVSGVTYSGSTGPSLTIAGAPSTYNNYKYKCVVTYMSQAYLTTTPVTLTVNALPTVTATASPSTGTVCTGHNVTLSGGGASSYSWSGSITNGVSFVPGSTATYTVTGTDANNCSNTATKLVTVNTLPTVTATASPVNGTVCSGHNITLSGGGASSYLWSGGVTDGTSFVPASTLTYTVTGTDGNNCSNTATKLVTVNTLPMVTATASPVNGIVCSGHNVTLSGGGASSYLWSGGVTDGTSFVPGSTATYTVTGTDANNCSNTATKLVTVNTLPMSSINSQTNVDCYGNSSGSVTISAANGTSPYQYKIGSGSYSSTNTFGSLNANSYTVTVEDANLCTTTQAVSITQPTQLNAASITGTNVTCHGANDGIVTVSTASTGGVNPYQYALNGGAYQSVTPFMHLAPGSYSVATQDANGCISQASNSVTITEPAVLTAAINTGSTPICYNTSPGTFSATASGGSGSYSYQWYNGAGLIAGSTASIYNPGNLISSNDYYCQVTDAVCGPVNTLNRSITVRAQVTVTASNSGPYVVGQTIDLTSSFSSATGYQWSGPLSYSSNVQNPTIPGSTLAMTGTYSVTATAAGGCTATASTDVLVATNATYIWTGANGTSWTTTSNWTPTAPTGGPNHCAIDVIIPSVTNNPVISSAIQVGNMEIDANAQLTLNAANISVCKNWVGSSGTQAVITGTGVVVLNGSAQQTISGKTQMQELMVENSFGVSMQAASTLDIYTALDLQTGNFDATSGTLTFKSNSVSSVGVIDNFSSGYNGTLTGGIKAERYYATSLTNDQHFMGSPVNAPSLAQFNASGTPGYVLDPACDETILPSNSPYGNVFSFDETHGTHCGMQQWKAETTGTAKNGMGYSILAAGTGTLVLSGTANLNASYALSGMTNSNWNNTTMQHHTERSGWQLVSNPYLANLSLTTTPTGFDNEIQVWNANGPYAGTYQPGTIGTDATVAPFQAFMVHKTNPGGTATFTMNSTDRVRTAYTFFQQNANQLNIVAANTTNGALDQTTVAFNTAASDTFDAQYDAVKMPGKLNRHTLYTMNGDLWMSRNILHDEATTSTVPMGFEPGANSNYTLTFNGLNSFDPTSYIYLEDEALGVMYNVRNGDYSFHADSADNWNRFALHFTPPALIATTDASCTASGIINIQQPGTANWNYTLTDNGHAIITSGTLNQSQVVTVGVPAGTYTLTLVDTNSYTVTKTILINGPELMAANFQLTKDTVQVNQNITLTATGAGAGSYQWNLGNGSTASGAVTSVSYTQPGVYTVSLSVTEASGCSAGKTQTIVVTPVNTTGINSLTGISQLKIWSSANKVYVDFTALQLLNASVTIYNILGQEISSEKITDNIVYQREIDNIDAAYMIVTVRNDNEITTRKVFINSIR